MAWSFGDGFDLYTAVGDMVNGYWDSGNGLGAFGAGRFAGSRSFIGGLPTGAGFVVKSSGQNDAVHHICVAMQQTVAISGSSLYFGLQLADGATPQCTIVFRSDGTILLNSGVVTGTTLATYSSAFTVINTWYQFEFEVVINNTTGSFTVRKNGNTTADFTATSLNTRGGTANNYANRLQITGSSSAANQNLDDFFWRSDASSVAWLGDIRCYTRMPASDASVQFSRAPTSFLIQNNPSATVGSSLTANNVRAAPVLAPTTGTLASLVCNLNAGITGHVKMALYDGTGSSGFSAGALLASSAELTNPSAGLNTFTVASGPTLTRGTVYWVAVWSDAAITMVGTGSTGTGGGVNSGNLVALTYTTSFPSPFAATSTSAISGAGCLGMNVTPFNAGLVNDTQQDAATSYVYDSTAGHADFYGIGAIASTPVSTIMVTTRGYMQKSDAGSRTAAVQLKSGGSTVASSTLTLTTSGWVWAWRQDLVDPATSAAWTAAAVNNAQIGPTVIA